jgi:hypothetical protein
MNLTKTTTAAEPQPAEMADRLAIVELISRMALHVDARAWRELTELFTDPVFIDYTSLNGGEPASLAPSALISGWRQALDRLDATQHIVAGHAVELDGDSATCAANVQGTHTRANHSGGPLWTVGGRYDFALRRTPSGWRISALTLSVQWASGNRYIMSADGPASD